jgi:hypothetical protein
MAVLDIITSMHVLKLLNNLLIFMQLIMNVMPVKDTSDTMGM